MTRATRCAEYIGLAAPCLYLAFELGSVEWKLGFTTEPGATPRVRTMPARDLERLTREIADARQWFGRKAATPVRSGYEAGRDGCWRHRSLTSRGIENVVVDSSSIEVNRRLRRAKSDGLDARQLLGMLLRYHAGERAVWSVVRVPTVEQEDRRQLHRELRTLKQERIRVANRMNGLLANQGRWLPPGTNIGAAAKTVRLWDGSPVPAALRARVERDWEHAQFLRTRIRELERERQRAIAHGHGEALAKVRQLLRLRAVGPGSAWVYVNAPPARWRKPRNARRIRLGWTPTHQVGPQRLLLP
jgi:transposase